MFNVQTNNLSRNKEKLVTLAVILACLVFSVFFPARDGFQGLTGWLFFFVIIPFLYIKLILKESVHDFGWSLENKKEGIFWGIGMLLITLVVFYVLFEFTDFGKNYILPAYAANSFWLFLAYEMIFVNLFIFTQEYFFRGFTLFSFADEFSYGAAALQFFLVALGLFLAGSLTWQFAPFLIISATSGIIAYRSRSFLYSYAAAFLSIIFLDSFLIYHLK